MVKVSLESVWRVFIKQFDLSPLQQEQFAVYIRELLSWNEQVNLTAAHDERELVQLHCADSLAITKKEDLSTVSALCDVGSGGGFPGIPLSIKYPDKNVYLLEVSHKKIHFLTRIKELLHLDNVTLVTIDWRTFLRKTDYKIDLFCARASLDPKELIRMFQPSCPYRNAHLAYWASFGWTPDKKVVPLVAREHTYFLQTRSRRLIILASGGATKVKED